MVYVAALMSNCVWNMKWSTCYTGFWFPLKRFDDRWCYRFRTMYESTCIQCMPVLGFHHGRTHGSFDWSDNKFTTLPAEHLHILLHALNDKFDEGCLIYYIEVQACFFFIIFVLSVLLFSLHQSFTITTNKSVSLVLPWYCSPDFSHCQC